MIDKILTYLIECVRQEAREHIRIEGRIDDEMSEKVCPLNGSGVIEEFFLGSDASESGHFYSLPLTDKLKQFIAIKQSKYSTEQVLLTYEFIEKTDFYSSKSMKFLYPLYFAEVRIELDAKADVAKMFMLDYEPSFSMNLPGWEISEEEKIYVRQDVEQANLWSSKIAIYKDSLPERISDNANSHPLLFIASIPKFTEYVASELESIKTFNQKSVKNTALRHYIMGKPIEADDVSPKDYIEIVEMNKIQEEAVRHAMQHSFTVITGPPGTGKSQVVVNLLANLAINNKTVLFASKNNKAVNTVLEKMEHLDSWYSPFIRLGNRREKEIGREKLLASLARPSIHSDHPVSHQEQAASAKIEFLVDEIHLIYSQLDDAAAEFRDYHENVLDCEKTWEELEEFRNKSDSSLRSLLRHIDQTVSTEDIDLSVCEQEYADLLEIRRLINRLRSDSEELQNRLDAKSAALVVELAGKIKQLSGARNIELLQLEQSLNRWQSWERSLFWRFLIIPVRPLLHRSSLGRVERILEGQDIKFIDYFLGRLKSLSADEYLNLLTELEGSLAYSTSITLLVDAQNRFGDQGEKLMSGLDQYFPGLKRAFIDQLTASGNQSDTSDEMMSRTLESIRGTLNYLVPVKEFRQLRRKLAAAIDRLNAYSTKSDLDTQFQFLKARLVDVSRAEFSAHHRTAVDSEKPRMKQYLSDYYKRWKEPELYEFFRKLEKHWRIWVTTNLSARYNIPLKPALFDYVVIDEASQNDLASVVPLLFRAKRAVIIGDPNQLRHITSLKRNVINKIAGKAKLPEGQLKYYDYEKRSTYDLAKLRFVELVNREPIRLNTHYRSHSNIVGFANRLVSDYRLFPKSYKRAQIEDYRIARGISWIHVDGEYRPNNTNREEAGEVVAFLKQQHAYNMMDDISVGVITPFRAQAELISDFLRKGGLVIDAQDIVIVSSTVHRFQGDERDVILYSPVISEGILPGKKRTLNWANGQSNFNLLNVAVTRARSALIVFGNMRFCGEQGGLHGELASYVKHFSYAATRTNGIADGSPTERLFYDALAKNGFDFEYQVPVDGGKYVLDFVLKGEDHYIAIELDGEQHNRSKSQDAARDLRVAELGYKVFRFPNRIVKAGLDEIMESLKRVVSTSSPSYSG